MRNQHPISLRVTVLCSLLPFTAEDCSSSPPVDDTAPRVSYYESTNPNTVRLEGVFTGGEGAVLGFVRHLIGDHELDAGMGFIEDACRHFGVELPDK